MDKAPLSSTVVRFARTRAPWTKNSRGANGFDDRDSTRTNPAAAGTAPTSAARLTHRPVSGSPASTAA